MNLTHRDAATVSIDGSVGSGKVSLLTKLVPQLREWGLNVSVTANDILTQEDADVLRKRFVGVVPESSVAGVETGVCLHTGIREDPLMSLQRIGDFLADHPELDVVLIESGGDNLATMSNSELVGYLLYVISVAGGDGIPRKRGPGVVDCDLLVVSKTDLAPHINADLGTMGQGTKATRSGSFVLIDCRPQTGIEEVLTHVHGGVLFA